MDSPYRASPGAQAAQQPRDTGIVGDIIDQFADRFAFFRELVQNSIDANTESIDVSLRYDDAQGILSVVVVDVGDGMGREVIEDGLLVLFRSTKENDDSKIGKFGVGFVSVLAVHPSIVRVVSSHAGLRHTLHLYPDFTFELFESGRTNRTGTSVELEIPLKPSDVEGFVAAGRQALNRWCRHATVMISFSAEGPGGATIVAERIDRPLSLELSLASVARETSDGTSAVVGLTEKPYAAFFNHGLLLYETHEPLAGNISFVIQDARLGHTLSRDNVRRDQHYERALDFVRELGASLEAEIFRSMHEALLDADPTSYQRLARTVHSRGVAMDRNAWPLPLVDPLRSTSTTDLQHVLDGGGWMADTRSPLTVALAEAQIPVVNRARATAPTFAESDCWFANLPQASTSSAKPAVDNAWFADVCQEGRDVHTHLTLVSPVTPSGADLVLLDSLARVLAHAHRRPSQLLLATLAGAKAGAMWVTGGPNKAFVGSTLEQSWILDNEQASRNPFRTLLRPALVLNSSSTSVAAARRQAESEPIVAAQTLARLLLLDRETLDVKRSQMLLEHSLANLLGGSP